MSPEAASTFEDVEEIPLDDELTDVEPAVDLPPVEAEVDPQVDPVAALEPKVGALALLVKNTKAVDDASYLVVCEQTKGINALIAEVDATFDPLVVNARKAVEDANAALAARKADLQAVRDTKAKHRGPLEAALTLNKGEIVRFIDAKEAADKAVKAEEDRRAREEAEARRAADVQALQQIGQAEQATVLAAQPLAVAPSASLARSGGAPKASGVAPKKVAKATAIVLAELVIGIADRLADPAKPGAPLDAIAVRKSALNEWATSRKPALGVAGLEVQSVSAGVVDMIAFVLAMAPILRTRAGGDAEAIALAHYAPSVDVFEPAVPVINKWVAAQGTALAWPGVTVEMVTDVAVSRKG